MLRATGAAVQVLGKSALPFIIAPTGTMANNGAITLGTALATTYANAFVFLPASAVAAGVPAAPAWLFCQMSSTTVGTVFNNVYTTGAPSIPASPTAFVTTGPGAYTGVTSAVTGAQFSIPAGTLTANSALRAQFWWSILNSAGNKTLTNTIGGVTINNVVLTTSNSEIGLFTTTNRGSQSAQISSPTASSSGLGTQANACNFTSINFAAAQTWAIGGTLAVATDYIVIEAYVVEVLP